MKFRYVGDIYSPQKIKFMGLVDFELGKVTDVDEKLAREGKFIVKALKGNPSFRLEEDKEERLPIIDAVVEEVKPKKGRK
jgi:hypothetical protein